MFQEQESLLHRIGKALRAEGEDIAHEPLPKRWVDLIHFLDEQERKRFANSPATISSALVLSGVPKTLGKDSRFTMSAR